jgi:hypothetical protein
VTPTPDQLTEQLAEALLVACPGDDVNLRAYDRARHLAPLVETLLADARTDGFRHGYTAGRTLTRQHLS